MCVIQENDRVVLTGDIPSHGLEAGDVGAVVFVHNDGAGYELEFVTLDGSSSRVVEVTADQVRPVDAREIPHARILATA